MLYLSEAKLLNCQLSRLVYPIGLLRITDIVDLSDTKAQELLAKMAISSDADSPFTLQQGLLRYKGRIWVGNNQTL
jgi:hypothetical protein